MMIALAACYLAGGISFWVLHRLCKPAPTPPRYARDDARDERAFHANVPVTATSTGRLS